MNITGKLKSWILMTAIGFGLCFGFSSCGMDIPKDVPTSYETMTIETTDITIPMKFSARLKGKSDITISPQVSGQVMKICVSEGDYVKVGTVLFVIDQRNAQLELEAAQANLEAAIAKENSAKLEYESNKNLYEKKIVSSYMYENSENTYKQAQAAVSQARASVNRAQVNLGFCTITSPISGVMGDIPISEGEQVTPMTPMATISGNESMSAEFSITESLIEKQVSAGYQKDSKTLEDFPEVTFLMKNGTEYQHKGHISGASGVVDAATGTLTCKATFPNPDGLLYSGIQGTVVLPIDKKDVIVIPQNAVVRLQDKSLVYKVKADSCATSVEVTTTDAGNGKDVIVNSGLNVGDVIVTVGANNVQEGQQVIF